MCAHVHLYNKDSPLRMTDSQMRLATCSSVNGPPAGSGSGAGVSMVGGEGRAVEVEGRGGEGRGGEGREQSTAVGARCM